MTAAAPGRRADFGGPTTLLSLQATAKYAESYDALVLGDHGSPA